MSTKVKDLMIGDWIHNNFTNDDYQVWPSFFAQATNYGRGLDRTLEDIGCEPIPLTEEILKVNGFEEHVGEKGAYGVTTAPYFKRDDSPEVFCDGHPFAVWFDEPVDIKYVHQLQHVLRLYGAEKEIKIKED